MPGKTNDSDLSWSLIMKRRKPFYARCNENIHLNGIKNIHSLTHTPAVEKKSLLRDAGMID